MRFVRLAMGVDDGVVRSGVVGVFSRSSDPFYLKFRAG